MSLWRLTKCGRVPFNLTAPLFKQLAESYPWTSHWLVALATCDLCHVHLSLFIWTSALCQSSKILLYIHVESELDLSVVKFKILIQQKVQMELRVFGINALAFKILILDHYWKLSMTNWNFGGETTIVIKVNQSHMGIPSSTI